MRAIPGCTGASGSKWKAYASFRPAGRPYVANFVAWLRVAVNKEPR